MEFNSAAVGQLGCHLAKSNECSRLCNWSRINTKDREALAGDAGEGGVGGVGGACSCWQEARTDTNTNTLTHTHSAYGE